MTNFKNQENVFIHFFHVKSLYFEANTENWENNY